MRAGVLEACTYRLGRDGGPAQDLAHGALEQKGGT